jgi:hypothetical protein
VPPRILRRVIRLDRRLERLAFEVPHRKSYTIERERLLAFADPVELGLPSLDAMDRTESIDLPRTLILLSTPTDDESLDHVPVRLAVRRYWRLLFHAEIHKTLEEQIERSENASQFASQRRREIGELEFAEIRSVLLKDEYLFPDPTDLETYIEFVAVYLELRHFAPLDLEKYFPAIRDWQALARMVERDIDHRELLRRCRPPDDWTGSTNEHPSATPLHEAPSRSPGRSWWSPSPTSRKTRAKKASAMGNSVQAAILQARAASQESLSNGSPFDFAAQELRAMVLRLQPVLQLNSTEVDDWCEALGPLLLPASMGIWPVEARLLYDLQKVCVEYERGVFKLDLVEWLLSYGRVPLRRPLPLLREVLITKHLRSAARRLYASRLDTVARQRLEQLLDTTVKRIEQRSRERIRPVLAQVLDDVGLVPRSIAETISRKNVIEELLDRVVEHGALNLGNLRDALSRSDLKLPDLSGIGELIRGDRLLRADRLLGRMLDGVYRPGAIYLRGTQRLSSLAFGTRVGRFITQNIALPFGGAWLAIEGMRHLVETVTGAGTPQVPGVPAIPPTTADTSRSYLFFAMVLMLGAWISLLMHRPDFRAWCLRQLHSAWLLIHELVVGLPTSLLRSAWMQRILRSPLYAAFRHYLLRPLVLTILVYWIARLFGRILSSHTQLDIYLAAALFLNSPVGRYADEWFGDFLVRAWHGLRIRVFAAAYQWTMETFHRLAVELERIVYGVDEWLRFRAGDDRKLALVKLFTGTCWFFISYLVVFVFTLLVEPQINPIKHFPVVTVSHKLLIPTAPKIIERLEPLVGNARAHTIVWSTIWLVPGVIGFLVWELKGNWQLYAANRSHHLTRNPLGPHGETVLGLLRPGFHSGTVPKNFATLRRALRKAENTGDSTSVRKKQAALQQVETAIQRFVERELLGLLREMRPGFLTTISRVDSPRLATNRIEVLVHLRDESTPLKISWEELDGRMTARVTPEPWLGQSSSTDRELLSLGLTSLFHRSGADGVAAPLDVPYPPPMTWQQWNERLEHWEPRQETVVTGSPT